MRKLFINKQSLGKFNIHLKVILGIIILLFLAFVVWGLYFHYFQYLYTKAQWKIAVEKDFIKCNSNVDSPQLTIDWEVSYDPEYIGGVVIINIHGNYKELGPISTLTLIDIINIDNYSCNVKNLSFLKNMHGLKDVYIAGTLNSLLGIENRRLNSLDVNASKLNSLEPLRNMTIDYLALDNLSLSNIEVLSTMTIKQLSLVWGSQIKDISPIGKIKSLEFLNLSGTGVKDLSSIAKCKTLTYLNLSATAVSDLSPLESTNIEKLYINKTQVDSLAPLYKMRKLKQVIIDKNIPALLNMTDAERKEFEIKFHKSSWIYTGDNANFYFKRPLSPQEKKNEFGY